MDSGNDVSSDILILSYDVNGAGSISLDQSFKNCKFFEAIEPTKEAKFRKVLGHCNFEDITITTNAAESLCKTCCRYKKK